MLEEHNSIYILNNLFRLARRKGIGSIFGGIIRASGN
jgi:hypothetical protein